MIVDQLSCPAAAYANCQSIVSTLEGNISFLAYHAFAQPGSIGRSTPFHIVAERIYTGQWKRRVNPGLKSPVFMHEITEWKKRSKEKYRYKIGLSNLGK